jgi:hypothetical protein
MKASGVTIEELTTFLDTHRDLYDRLQLSLQKFRITFESIGINIDGSLKICSEHEFRMSKQPFELCLNSNDFKGECGEPSIRYAHTQSGFLVQDIFDKLMQLFE